MKKYIEICRWEEFQHYKQRDPLWIKNYTRLLHDDGYLRLTEVQRATLHGLWLLYAVTGRCVPLDVKIVNRWLRLNVKMATLEALSDAGFIRFVASESLAARYTREEKSREETPPTPPNGGVGKLSREDLRRYTGCRYVYNGRAPAYVQDPLGTDKPPAYWPHPRPLKAEILEALNA